MGKFEKFREISTRPTRPYLLLQCSNACCLAIAPSPSPLLTSASLSLSYQFVTTIAIFTVARIAQTVSAPVDSIAALDASTLRAHYSRTTTYSTGAPLPFSGKSGAPGRIRAVQIRQTIAKMA
jgi:hypothetical protein